MPLKTHRQHFAVGFREAVEELFDLIEQRRRFGRARVGGDRVGEPDVVGRAVFGVHVPFGRCMAACLFAHLGQRNRDEQPPDFHGVTDLELTPRAAAEERAKHRLDDVFAFDSLCQPIAEMPLGEVRQLLRVQREQFLGGCLVALTPSVNKIGGGNRLPLSAGRQRQSVYSITDSAVVAIGTRFRWNALFGNSVGF